MNHRHTLSLLASSALLFSAVPAQAYGFDCLSNNNFANCATAGQYGFDVTEGGGGTVYFKFTNNGASASSITDIYFDDKSLFQSLTVGSQSSGVDFSAGASPGDLPAGNDASPDFVATSALTADSNPPAQPNGVNPGEWVQLSLLLASDKDFLSVLNDLSSGDLRVGIHVQGFSDGGSESFITTPVPEPEIYAMALVALGVLGMYRRRQA
jgi:hypothetical protein